MLRSAPASSTVTGTPPRTRLAAAPSPAGPAPAINTRSSIAMTSEQSGLGQAFARHCGGALGLVFASHQLSAQELAHRRARNRLDENVTSRPLKVGQPTRAPDLPELGRLDCALAFDEGSHDLAPAFVRKPYHRHFRNGGMQRQAAFDLDWRDNLSAADNHIVGAAGDEEIAVAVEI